MLHTVTRLPDLNSHSCRILRTNARCDIPCRTFRALDASRRGTVASMGQLARGPNSSERACSMACRNDADCVRFCCLFGRRRFPSRRARCYPARGATADAPRRTGRSKSLGRPSRSLPELRAAPGVGGLPSGSEGWQGGAPVPPALLAKGNQTGPVSSPVPVQGLRVRVA